MNEVKISSNLASIIGSGAAPTDYGTVTTTNTAGTTGGSEAAPGSYRKPIAVRFDLIPAAGLRRLAAIYEEGAKEYGPANYLKPENKLPFSNIINHMFNHLTLYLSGDRTEDHFAKCAWAFFTLMALESVRPEENDLFEHGIRPNAYTAVPGRLAKEKVRRPVPEGV